MLVKITVGFLAFALIGGLAAAAVFSRDGAIVNNSGSTNSPGYQIKVWSDGTAQITTRRLATQPSEPRSVSTPRGSVAKFFADLQTARDRHVQGSSCMKSASFGSTTSVSWHGWISPDLSCPSGSAAMSALSQDVRLLVSAIGMQTGPRMIHLPIGEPRRPESMPQATASPGYF